MPIADTVITIINNITIPLITLAITHFRSPCFNLQLQYQ